MDAAQKREMTGYDAGQQMGSAAGPALRAGRRRAWRLLAAILVMPAMAGAAALAGLDSARAQQSSPLVFIGPAVSQSGCTFQPNVNTWSYVGQCPFQGSTFQIPMAYNPDIGLIMEQGVNSSQNPNLAGTATVNYHRCTSNRIAPSPQQPGDFNWFNASFNGSNTDDFFSGATCNIHNAAQFYGSALQSCVLLSGNGGGTVAFNCAIGTGGTRQNVITFHHEASQILVNGAAYACTTAQAPPPGDNPPPDAASQAWLRADNNNGSLVNIQCNLPPAEAVAYLWSEPLSGVFPHPDSTSFPDQENMTVTTAKQYAETHGGITHFYLDPVGTAKFFSGTPSYSADISPVAKTLYRKMPSPFVHYLPRNIYAYYPFDINGNDESGQGNNATLGDGVLFQTGREGNALRFSSSNTNARVTLPALAYPANTGFGIALWVLPGSGMATTGTSNLASIMGPLYIDTQSNKIKYLPSNSSFSLESPDGVTPGSWVHIAVTYSPVTAEADLYINGARVASATGLPALNFAPWGATIGGIPSSATPPYAGFLGAVEQVFLYQRALLPGEISYLGKFTGNNRRSFDPQSASTDGLPGYKPRLQCDDGIYNRFHEEAGGSVTCSAPHFYCGLSRVSSGSEFCACPAGQTPNATPGTGCTPASQGTTPTMALTSINQGNLLGRAITLTNASYAFVRVVPRNVPPAAARILDFQNRYCGGQNNPSPSIQAACTTLQKKNGQTCEDLGMMQNPRPRRTSQQQPVLKYPNYTIWEWGNIVNVLAPGIRTFAVININFWETNNTAPCGVPLGNLIDARGYANTYDLNHFGSMVITRAANAVQSSVEFYKARDVSQPSADQGHVGTTAIAGHFLRFKGQDATSDEMGKWTHGDPNSFAGRTAVGYDPVADTLKFFVLPGPNSGRKGSLGLKARDVGRWFGREYQYVLLLDGSGSSTLSYWEKGEQKYTKFYAQKHGETMRTNPTALIIAPAEYTPAE